MTGIVLKNHIEFLSEEMPHRNVASFIDPAAMAYVEKVNNGMRSIPTIVFPDGSILVEPTNAELARKLGLKTRAQRQFYDTIVIGGGPAGLTAELYLAREGQDVLVIEKAGLGCQAGVTQTLDNYPGFDEGIPGAEFGDRLGRQARRFGVEILQANEVVEIFPQGPYLCAILQMESNMELKPFYWLVEHATAGWKYPEKTS